MTIFSKATQLVRKSSHHQLLSTMTKFTGSLVGMGNPLLDISADVGQDILDKYDVKLDNAILAEDKHVPIYKELVDNYSPQYIAGGATQNSIRVAQWIMTANGKPGQTAYFGCVGNDSFGNQLEECAAADGVKVHYMKDESTPTGTCAVLVKDGERCLIANLAAANNFKPSHLETDESKAIYESASLYYIAGFFLTVSVDALKIIAEHSVANNKTFCLNLSAPFIIDFFADQVATALEYADFVFCNESEAEAYGKKHELGDDLKEIALKIAASPKKNEEKKRFVIFTQGSTSTIVAHDGKVEEYKVVPLPKEDLVDTNGAGDAFVGGFLAGVMAEKSVGDSVELGHEAARFIIQQPGTTLTKPCEIKL
ncbi:adenosine kinase [Skeletonema marinoi]|uniref:Adenosine kinase n=2 Tax=Skeletonema marinoi TaxID=267567 RepID=A0AAD8Y2X7_9STRA|nr:adenosine kinase [Skeletonema marinoi]